MAARLFSSFRKKAFSALGKAFYGGFSVAIQPREVAEWSIAAVLKTVEG